VTVESLYPFLYGGEGDGDAALREAVRSTASKAAEIVALRRSVLEVCGPQLERCAYAMADRLAAGGRVFTFGNGGSSTDAQDLARLFVEPPRGRAIPAVCLAGDIAVITALANDVGFDVVFARQLAAFAQPVDIAVGVSTSGGSENILRAFAEAEGLGLLTVGLAGYEGGPMADADTIDHLFVIPSASVHRIQEAQTTVYHVLWALTQQALGSS
jgi:D-sedoheptulose 7-phosphate isomerase